MLGVLGTGVVGVVEMLEMLGAGTGGLLYDVGGGFAVGEMRLVADAAAELCDGPVELYDVGGVYDEGAGVVDLPLGTAVNVGAAVCGRLSEGYRPSSSFGRWIVWLIAEAMDRIEALSDPLRGARDDPDMLEE